MNSFDFGGPAFPSRTDRMSPHDIHGSIIHTVYPGMTLHDYYAAHAPITLQEAAQVAKQAGEKTIDDAITALVILRIKYADAMLAERSKKAKQ